MELGEVGEDVEVVGEGVADRVEGCLAASGVGVDDVSAVGGLGEAAAGGALVEPELGLNVARRTLVSGAAFSIAALRAATVSRTSLETVAPMPSARIPSTSSRIAA